MALRSLYPRTLRTVAPVSPTQMLPVHMQKHVRGGAQSGKIIIIID